MSSQPERHVNMALENLCIDCLENIFRYLPMPDLLNVADTSKKLKIAAGLTFSSQLGKKFVRINGITSHRRHLWFIGCRCVSTGNLKIMLQLVRCFGHLVHRMKIELLHNLIDDRKLLDINFERLISYVNEYCVESLTDFTLLGVDLKDGLNHFVKPFPNIHTVCVQSSKCKNVSLIGLFPKMLRLTYHCNKMDELVAIERDIQNLEHLEIVTECEWGKWDASLQRSMLQLRSLTVFDEILYPSEISLHLFSNLQELKLISMPTTSTTEITTQFHLKTVKQFRIFYPLSTIPSFPVIPLSFDHLKELDLQFNANNTFRMKDSPEPFYDFILRHPTILKLRIINVPGLLSLRRLMNILPLLEEAELFGEFADDDIIHFMNGMKALKKLKIRIVRYSDSIITDVKDRLEIVNEWHGERIDGCSCKFTRKRFNR